MKKLLTTALLITLTACGGGGGSSSDSNDNSKDLFSTWEDIDEEGTIDFSGQSFNDPWIEETIEAIPACFCILQLHGTQESGEFSVSDCDLKPERIQPDEMMCSDIAADITYYKTDTELTLYYWDGTAKTFH